MRAIGKISLAAAVVLFSACLASAQYANVAVGRQSGNPNLTAVFGTVNSQTAGGWAISVDSSWLDGPGYWPLRVKVTPALSVTADRELLIRISAHPYYGPANNSMIVTEQFLSVPSGTAAGKTIGTTVSVPPSNFACEFNVEIIDPTTPKGTVFLQQQIRNVGSRNGTSGLDVVLSKYPHILFVGKTMPDTSAITDVLPPLENNSNYPTYPAAANPAVGGATDDDAADGSQAETPTATGSDGNPTDPNAKKEEPGIPLPSALAIPIADLPERWIDYSSLDIVVLSIDQLSEIAKAHPAACRAILDWTRAGGNLWVTGVSPQAGRGVPGTPDQAPWERMAELDQLLAAPSSGDAEKEKNDASDWIEPTVHQDEIEKLMDRTPPNTYPYYGGPQPYQPASVNTPKKAIAPLKSLPAIRLREYGMGTVAAIGSSNPFAGDSKWSPTDWAVLLSAIGKDRWLWNHRHGVNLGQMNEDFWNFLIPGVGLAPVRTFQVFITLFVLGIGPVNYWLLRRRKSLYLLVVTVPLSAAAVTGVLFGYGLLADGLGTRVRVRSVTRVDPRGEAVTWSRLSYYAGIAPSEGLTFSPQTAVYPILNKPEFDYSGVAWKRLLWDRQQRLVQGWLDARTPTQYLTIRSGPTSSRLKVTQAGPGGAGLPAINNRLGTPIERVVLRGLDGKYYLADDVAEGAEATAKETTAEQVRAWLNKAMNDHRPDFPLGADSRDLSSSMITNRSYYWYPFGNADTVQLANSRLERTLAMLPGGGAENSATFGDGDALPKPGTYVALVSRLPEVELGLESAREEASYHVIVGEW
jgi:hypothetical protein